MATITTWFTLGLLGMVLGTATLAYGIRYVPDSKRRQYLILVSIPGIAVLAYAVMSLGIGSVTVRGAEVHIPRYVDWLLTTPLNILFLGLLAGADRELLGKLLSLQLLTIAAGLVGALIAPPWNYVVFLGGSAAFLAVVYLLYYEVCDVARETLSESGVGLYETLRNFVVVLWTVYPVIWLLTPTGVGVMDVETSTLVVTYLDVVTKVGFGLIALHGLSVVLDVEDDSPVSSTGDYGSPGVDGPDATDD